MTTATSLEAEVGARFDQLHDRFKQTLPREDVRLRGLIESLGTIRGQRILDLGCGKGRFGRRLAEEGATVVGLDRSRAMLAQASDLPRIHASARRLPLCTAMFDAVIAVEVIEHLPAMDDVLHEVHRVLRPGGLFAIVDKNAGALNSKRPWIPALAVKAIDERRGRWMYPHGGPVRERWFWPEALKMRLRDAGFDHLRVTHLLSPREAAWAVFRRVPRTRLLTLWTARALGGSNVG